MDKLNNTRSWRFVLMVLALLVSLVFAACGSDKEENSNPNVSETTLQGQTSLPYSGKKIVWVDSYHAGYGWSDSIFEGIETGIEDTGVELKVIHMDTKNNPGDEFGEQAALAAKAEIDAFAPDVVIACDDNAQRYLIVPYYKGTEMPVVFCGVNWDASPYGYPASNVTGMVEVDVMELLVSNMRTYAAGDQLAFLGKNDESEVKNSEIYLTMYPDMVVRFVDSYEELQATFLELQDEVDMIFISNIVGIKGMEEDAAKQFFLENTHIPTGVGSDWLMDYALLGLTRVGQEQGQWASETALRIIDGTPVSSIPITQNVKGQLYINLDIAERLDIVFSPTLLRNATIIGRDTDSQ